MPQETKQERRRKEQENRRNFQRARNAEITFAAQLRKIARHVGDIVNSFPVGDPQALPQIMLALQRYAETLDPWAKAVVQRMQFEVAQRGRAAWQKLAASMGRTLREELSNAPTGVLLREFMRTQVELIKSLPLEAAQRVHDLTLEGITNATRAKEIAKEIYDTGHVTRSRAELIARTEVARTAAGLDMVRAQSVDSPGYYWRTVGDSRVRPSHKKMEGVFVRWDTPPTLDKMTDHAGMFPNCRCIAEPVIPIVDSNGHLIQTAQAKRKPAWEHLRLPGSRWAR